MNVIKKTRVYEYNIFWKWYYHACNITFLLWQKLVMLYSNLRFLNALKV